MHKITLFLVCLLALASCKSTKESVADVHSSDYIKAFHEGVRLKMNGDVDEALEKFKYCAVLDPKDDAVQFGLAQLYLMKNDVSNASIHTKKAVELDPDNIHYQSELAFMYEELKQHEQAALIFEKMSKKQVQNMEFYLGAAENWARAGKITKAIEALNTLEKYTGASPEIAVQKFRLYAMAKDDKNAIQTLLDAHVKYPDEPNIIANLVDVYMQQKKYAEGMRFLTELVRVDPANGLAMMMLGEMQMQTGEEKQGLQNLKNSIKSEGPSLDQKMTILISLLQHFSTDSDMKELVEYMTVKYPKSAKSHSIKGDYYFKNNQIDLAIEAYKKAVESDPNLYEIWNQVLLLEYQNKKWEALLTDSEKCLALYPIQPLPYFTAGIALIQNKKYAEAEARLQEALDLIVADVTLEAEILGQLGEANFAQGKTEEGKSFYQKALAKQPKSLFLKNNFAYRLLLQNSDLNKAKTLVNEVMAEKPNDAWFMSTKAYLLFREANYAEALKLYEEANKSLPNDKIILDQLGDCFYFLNEKDKAIEYWKNAKAAGSSNQTIDKKIQTKTYYEPKF
jgi:tetratricopeptide (TPR) repeat protein